MLKQSGFTYTNKQKFVEFIYADEKNKIPVIIGNDVWIGPGVSIIAGTKIGDGAIIMANATVTKDIDPYTIVGGVPARVIRKRFTDLEIEKILEFQWWLQPEKWIQENVEAFESVEKLLTCKKQEINSY